MEEVVHGLAQLQEVLGLVAKCVLLPRVVERPPRQTELRNALLGQPPGNGDGDVQMAAVGEVVEGEFLNLADPFLHLEARESRAGDPEHGPDHRHARR